VGNFHSRERLHFRDTNNTAEVPGAQVGTIKKGVQTSRVTNPLSPVYILPGATEIGATHNNDPYATAGSSMDSKFVQIKK
jgi:hypothetical protein